VTGTALLGLQRSRGHPGCHGVRGRACATMPRTAMADRLVRGVIRRHEGVARPRRGTFATIRSGTVP